MEAYYFIIKFNAILRHRFIWNSLSYPTRGCDNPRSHRLPTKSPLLCVLVHNMDSSGGEWQESSLLAVSFHKSGILWSRLGGHQQSYPVVSPVTGNNDQPGNSGMGTEEQLLLDWIWGLFPRRKHMLGSVNLSSRHSSTPATRPHSSCGCLWQDFYTIKPVDIPVWTRKGFMRAHCYLRC